MVQVVLHVAKVWAVCVLATLAVVGALAFGWAAFDHQFRDRLTGNTTEVTATVTGQHRNEFGCGSKYKSPGWDWDVTWTQDGKERSGSIEKCDEAPAVGTEITSYVDSEGEIGGTSTDGYYRTGILVALLMGSLIAWVYLIGHGREAFRAVRAEAGRDVGA